MFYFSSRPKKQVVKYVALPAQFMQQRQYFQIYENGRPLRRMMFETHKEAKLRLRGLCDELNAVSGDLYEYRLRSAAHLPVGRILGLKKIYGDGTHENITFVIQKISVESASLGE